MKPIYKPYQQAWVKKEGPHIGRYTYIGEVISYPIPDTSRDPRFAEDTIMVRRVPGHPGTLEELPIGILEPVSKRDVCKWVMYATVAGRGQFPVDMLRYDNCAPVNFKLVADRWGDFTKPEIDPKFGLEGLWVAKACRSQHSGTWTGERWHSFLWGLKHEKIIQLHEELA